MSASPTRMTVLGSADSFNPAAAGFSSGFGSGEVAGEVAGLGFPSGNAVLNLPVNRTAIGYSTPVRLRSLTMWPAANDAVMLSTRPERFEDLSSTVSVSPSAGVPEKVPVNATSKLSVLAVTTSSLLIAVSFSVSTAGFGPSCSLATCSMSATTFPASNVSPQALNNLSRFELLIGGICPGWAGGGSSGQG